MTPFLRRSTLAMTLVAAWGAAPAQQAAPPAPMQIEFALDPLVECHFYLKTYSNLTLKPDAASGANFASEVRVYRDATTTIQDPAVWRWFEDQVVAGPDTAAIRAAAKTLPPALDNERNRTGVNMLVEGIDAAWPKFQAVIWPQHQRSLNRIFVPARKRFLAKAAPIGEMLSKSMSFAPIDAPITVYTVVRAGGVSSWGKTPKGYYTIIGQYGLSPLSLVESGLHEATHLVEALQPFDAKFLLREVRRGLPTDAPEQVDAFLHGLVAYNAGQLVRRNLDATYMPAGVRAPGQEQQYRPFLSTYEVIWNEYLDGKMTRAQIAPKLVEEFVAVRKLQAAQPGK